MRTALKIWVVLLMCVLNICLEFLNWHYVGNTLFGFVLSLGIVLEYFCFLVWFAYWNDLKEEWRHERA